MMEPGKLKFAKRKLRVQKCKSSTVTRRAQPPRPPVPKKALLLVPPSPQPIINADILQAKLTGLSKEERKVVKGADKARIARRLAKKARVQSNRHMTLSPDKLGKKRAAYSRPSVKRRVRSDKAVMKMNVKK
jgi:nucleolar protein 12